MSTTAHFPAHWRTPVEVYRSGGTDPKGNQLPGSAHVVTDCLVTTQTTAEEPESRSDMPETTAWLYTTPGADFVSQDRVTVPPGPLWAHGRFLVNGDPDFGPLGTRVPLRRV